MSARSDPSMAVSNDAGRVEKQVRSPMLTKYLADLPTLPEKLSVARPSTEAAKLVGGQANDAKEFLQKWQASWEKK
ncbi:hypothetical protein L207DRAFT_639743 [Hyaloscypha variabilis F]|uniref:Uncharacterized protein n=1 Tax=Hyaloscypha variabilis (strain UAMH 11265 / GT02V1 / F) TaxID=1149755 RepID=A0A2J6R3B0_HYAVF|nr:hypothetical protein L207DRAFT_639743 [Hyaloscypha variabilis F]